MNIKAKFEGRDAVLGRLRKLLPDTEQEVAAQQMASAQELAGAISVRAPHGATGEYARSIEADRIAGRPGKQLLGLRQTKDPNATGVFADFMWRFLEFGTVKMPALPHIFPTYRAYKKRIRRKVAGALNKAVRKARGK
ncbi:MAG: HK97 gp10 family phage protein [Mesorhizobium sp.]|nr:MAG: HK97 gp10 family phage protein [Mesorhizobium sp.]